MDLLISNAGILTPGPLEVLPLNAIRHEFEVNVNGESAEDIDFEFVPDSVKRQNLPGAGRQDSSVAYEKIHAAFLLDCGFARPNFDGGFVSNVALAQIDRPTRRLFEVRDLV